MVARALAGTPARSMLVAGSLLLVIALILYVVNGVLLMGYDDGGYGDQWRWSQAKVWLASLPTGARAAFWVTTIGAPASLAAGGVLVALGAWRAFGARSRRPQ